MSSPTYPNSEHSSSPEFGFNSPPRRTNLPPINTAGSHKSKFKVCLSPETARGTLRNTSSLSLQDNQLEFSPPTLFSPRLAPIKAKTSRVTQSSLLPEATRHVPATERNGYDDDQPSYLEKLLRTTTREEAEADDEKPKETIGEKAITDYYMHFKKLHKVKDQNAFRDLKDSIYTSSLRKSEDLRILPLKMGFIKEKGKASSVEIRYSTSITLHDLLILPQSFPNRRPVCRDARRRPQEEHEHQQVQPFEQSTDP